MLDLSIEQRTGTALPLGYSDDLDALVAGVQRQDDYALKKLYERFGRQVYSLALAVTRNKETAEEVTQDAFLKVWNNAERYEPGTNFPAWLLRLTRNLAIDRLRGDKHTLDANPVWAAEEAPAPDPRPNEDIRWMYNALRDHLTDVQRQAIELAFLHGLTHEQIADRLDTPLGTIKTRIRDGIQRLRAAWETEGSVQHD